MGPGESRAARRVWGGLYRPVDKGCGLGDSYVQGPATGETGIQGPATGQAECLSPASAGGGHLAHMCTFSLASGLPGDKASPGDTENC